MSSGPFTALALVMAPFTSCLSISTPLAPPARLPPPLTPSDGVHTFTYDSVQRRLPLIAEAVIANNPTYPAKLVGELRALADEIAVGEKLQPLKSTEGGWPEMLAPLLEEGAMQEILCPSSRWPARRSQGCGGRRRPRPRTEDLC